MINVGILGDTTVEPSETVIVTLSNPTGATLSDATATGTITNDDLAPTLSIADVSAAEGNNGTILPFTVTLSRAYASPVTVGYATSNGTATAGSDYTAASGTITFAAGQVSQVINVGILGDTTVEQAETIIVTLSNPSGATLSRAVAAGTITDDDGGSLLFNGDYSTGDFSQWPNVQTRNYNGDGANYVQTYSASVISDPVKGLVGRFEVRSGDVPPFGGGERAEDASTAALTGGLEGQTRWYRFSTKFDPTFSQNHATGGWAITNQFHPDTLTGSPPLAWDAGVRNGYWTLTANRQSAPQVYLGLVTIFQTPLNVGNWFDVKMQIHWSTSDTTGWVRVWINDVPQILSNGAYTYYVRTLIPGTNTTYYKEGMYRSATSLTDIVYHAGFRAATTEAGLG